MVTNTPITYVVDERPLTTARIIQVDTFNAQGQLPQNLGQVSERAKDIQYSSKSWFQHRTHTGIRRTCCGWSPADRQTAARVEV